MLNCSKMQRGWFTSSQMHQIESRCRCHRDFTAITRSFGTSHSLQSLARLWPLRTSSQGNTSVLVTCVNGTRRSDARGKSANDVFWARDVDRLLVGICFMLFAFIQKEGETPLVIEVALQSQWKVYMCENILRGVCGEKQKSKKKNTKRKSVDQVFPVYWKKNVAALLRIDLCAHLFSKSVFMSIFLPLNQKKKKKRKEEDEWTHIIVLHICMWR